MKLLTYIIDDEVLGIERLKRLLEATGRVTIVGSSVSPQKALRFLQSNRVDLLFLDIQMPLMNGFELLGKLHNQPLVVFTTAYDEYALKAFEVNAVDYLLKPIEASDLHRALNKMERFHRASDNSNDLRKLVETLAQLPRSSDYLTRIASRLGDRVCFVDLARVTHFYADEKLTYAAADGKSYCLDHTISGLEEKLDSRRFIRIHRATLVNIDWIKEIAPGFKGNLIVRLKDANRTELTVARNRVHDVKKKLGL